MWRAWCHRAHQGGQPLDNTCAIGPYNIQTTALGFGQGGYVSFKTSTSGYALSIGANEELGRDSYFDEDWTYISYYCSLQ